MSTHFVLAPDQLEKISCHLIGNQLVQCILAFDNFHILSNIMLQSLYCFFESECKKPKSSLYTTIQSTYISAVILHICWYVLYSKRDSYSQARTCKETPVWLDI